MMARSSSLFGLLVLTILALAFPGLAAMYTQCPAIGADTGCSVLLVVNPDHTISVMVDATQVPYDGTPGVLGDDTLVGVQNNSSSPVFSIALASSTNIFGFDRDGICTFSNGPPCGATGYEGPNVTFSGINQASTQGTVNFTGGLQPGSHTYFGLENMLSSATPINTAPRIQACPASTISTGTPFSQPLIAIGGTAPLSWIAGGSLPSGLTLSSAGLLSGTPLSPGAFSYSITVQDGANLSDSLSCTTTVTGPATAVITTGCPLPNGSLGAAYGPLPFTQTGFAAAPTWTVTAGALPTGINLNTLGVVIGVPTTTGTFLFTVQASSPPVTATEPCSVTITAPVVPPAPPPPPLMITTSCPLPPATVGSLYQAGLSASGGGAPVAFSIGGGLPPGLFLDNNTVRGTPTTAGNFIFTLQVANQTAGCSIMVNPNPLVLSGCPLPNGAVGSAYSAGVSLQGGAPPYSFFAGGLPPGLSLSNGAIAGTPSAAGTYSITLRASDSSGINTSQSCPVTIATAPPLTIITSSPLPTGTVGVVYSAALSATGGIGALTWSGSGLPSNLSLSSNGAITGTPVTAGTSSISATVTDSRGTTATALFTLVVGTAPPVITSSCPLPGGRAGATYTAPLSASAGSPPYRWDLSAGTLPAGLSVDPSGAVSGKPSATGAANFTLRVTDQNSATATQACSLSITDALTITSINPASFTAGGVEPTLKNGSAPLVVTGTGFSADTTLQWNGAAVTTTVNSATSLSAQISASFFAQPGTATVTAKSTSDGAVSNGVTVQINLPPFPNLTLSDLPDPIAPAQQPAMGLQIEGLSSPATYPFDITGTVNLAVVPDPSAGSADPLVKFLNDGLSAPFTLKAGSSQVQFPPLMSTGTVASTLTFSVANLAAAGQNLPSLPASKTTHIALAAPVVQNACYTSVSGGFTLSVTGYSTTRSLTQMSVNFTAAAGAVLPTSSLTVDLKTASASYFLSSASMAAGGLFTLTLPLAVQGDPATVAGFALTLSNSVGQSASQMASKCP